MQIFCRIMHVFHVWQQHIDVQDRAMSREGAEIICERGIQEDDAIPQTSIVLAQCPWRYSQAQL